MSTKTWQEKYNEGIKELHELTVAIEIAINEGGIRGNVAKDNLSSQFNDKLKQFISDLRKQTLDEVISYIGKDQGWEESEDTYREHFGLETKYK